MVELGKIIQKSRLFSKANKLLVAVSGGLDSMVLLHVLVHEGFRPSLIHVNYGLRGEDSMLDEALICQVSKQLGLTLFLKQIDLPKGPDLQERARDIRYQFFDEVIRQHDFDYVLTAHHADDLLEGFFMQLNRGAGIVGLKSMDEKHNHCIRPFLQVRKTELLDYAQAHDVAYRHDLSNDEVIYQRNYWRNALLPEIDQRYPHFRDMALRSIDHLKSLYRFFSDAFLHWKSSHVLGNEELYTLSHNQDTPQIFIEQQLADWAFHPSTIEKICRSLDESGKIFINRLGRCVLVDRNRLLYYPEKALHEFSIEWNIDQPFLQTPLGSLECAFKTLQALPNWKNCTAHTAWFDADALNGHFRVRNWEHGDKIAPMGMQGRHRKLQDIFTDHKLSIYDKHLIPVVTMNDKIVWVPGIIRSNDYLVNDRTKNILEMLWKPMH